MFVFVYGTLKRGEPNYHWLTNSENGESKFVTKANTSVEYPLVIASRYNIPFLLDKPGTGKRVQGEIFQIDEKMLSNLDVLEEYPKLYTRRIEKFISSDTGEIIEAWAYFLPTFRPELLDLPFEDCYTSIGKDNPYVASDDDLHDPEDIYTAMHSLKPTA